MAVINGDSSNNTLIGTDEDDVITGFGGDDTIFGLGGDDTAIFDVDNDGADRVDLGTGIDVVRVTVAPTGYVRVVFAPDQVGNGDPYDSTAGTDDTLAVGIQKYSFPDLPIGPLSRFDDEGIVFRGEDIGLFVQDPLTGDDAFYARFDVIALGTIGTDIVDTIDPSNSGYINGGMGDDILDGGDQDDVLVGGTGNDVLDGGGSRDTLIGGAGDDIIRGGKGLDTVILNIGTDGADTIDLGSDPESSDLYGADEARISSSSGQVRLTFAADGIGNGSVDGTDGGLAVRMQAQDADGTLTGPVSRIEDEGVILTASRDTVFTIRDMIDGVPSSRTFEQLWLGTDGNDDINVDRDIGGGDGLTSSDDPQIRRFPGQYANGGLGDDVLIGGESDNVLIGGAGDDYLSAGGSGNDVLVGGPGRDTFQADEFRNDSNDTILDFGRNDVFALYGDPIPDGDGDGRILLGSDGMVDINPEEPGGTVTFGGDAPLSTLRFLGSLRYDDPIDPLQLNFYADGATPPPGAIEGTFADDRFQGAPGKQIFFFDTALPIVASDIFGDPDFGDDSIGGFGMDDLLVTTAVIADANGDGRIAFGRDRILDLSDGTTVRINDGTVRALEFDGSLERDGVTYFVYSRIGSSGAGVDDLFG